MWLLSSFHECEDFHNSDTIRLMKRNDSQTRRKRFAWSSRRMLLLGVILKETRSLFTVESDVHANHEILGQQAHCPMTDGFPRLWECCVRENPPDMLSKQPVPKQYSSY
ncbi:predicted protein [Coccidioides posadasii str. Silveira]|uniref:Predicted protein n=2 Tax=Coccidioides posadasii TaxID=199306 RepID=E9DE86_COCPS|nr:predicted protein [Coccidioides posadasii str. Silveira]KMM70404.1 hypothetical protein CPAG_06716 [Coccidioides posadasii RMSCC 3488]